MFRITERFPSKKKSVTEPHELICLEHRWIKSTRFLRYLQHFDSIFSNSPSLLDRCKDWHFSNKIIDRLATRSKHSGTRHTLRRLLEVGDGKQRNQHIVVLSLLLILCFETADGCWAVVEDVKERVFRCDSAQRQAYVLVVQSGAHACELSSRLNQRDIPDEVKKIIQPVTSLTSDSVMDGRDVSEPTPAGRLIALESNADKQASYTKALHKIHFMVEDYLDSHKENAFKSAFQEPARYYFHLCDNEHHRDHVNVHGLNGYLCLVRGWFGCHLPMIPLTSDGHTFKGCADVWSGLSEKAWDAFSDPGNFGKDFEGITALNRSMLKTRKHGGYGDGHSFVGRNAGDMERSAERKDPKYLQYANKFAFFFSKEFLVKRMFEVLNGEGKPEYVGFKVACDELYPLFKHTYNLEEGELLEYLYDEDIMNIDIDRATLFLWWCGVCDGKYAEVPKCADTAEKSKCEGTDVYISSDDNTCPICFEEKDNIQPIAHWEAKGDISGHKMCADCAEKYTKNECPFCHEVSIKENLLGVIKSLVRDVKMRSSDGHPDDRAAILESWQFFEMEYGHNPKVIHRVGTLILQDEEFKPLLEDGVRTGADWMRDAAGIFFRLHSLSIEGHLNVTDSEKALLLRTFEVIMKSLHNKKGEGHFYGALYTQAMVLYICALQSGQNTEQLEIIVRSVGEYIVTLYKKYRRSYPSLKQKIPERIVSEYMEIVTDNVWGGKSRDPVWKAFYNQQPF